MLTQLFHLHALSALHVGVGQAVGSVDLPIARAKATHLPLVPGSALKGVIRDEFVGSDPGISARLFGPERISGSEDGHAGALAFGDAHLLLLPVRSLAGVMALVTCPFVLGRYAADLRRAGLGEQPTVPEVASGSAEVTASSALAAVPGKLVLDDLDLDQATGSAQAWGERIGGWLYSGDEPSRRQFLRHFAILSDQDFSFLADTATEVRARVRIDDARGVVARGALWYEENLPAESVLWGLIGVDRSRMKGAAADREQIRREFLDGLPQETLLQVGGKATIGRGLVRFLPAAAERSA